MSRDQQVTEDILAPTSKHLTRLLLDVGTSDLVIRGVLPGRLTQDEIDGMVAYLNTPLTEAELEEMNRLSSRSSRLSRTQVYIILVLVYEANWNFNQIAKTFGISTKAISAINRGEEWTGVFYRYCRDIGVDPVSLAAR